MLNDITVSRSTKSSVRVDRRAVLRCGAASATVGLDALFGLLHETSARGDDASWIDGKKIIDPHVHVVDPRHPGVPKLATSDGIPLNGDLHALARALANEMLASGTSTVLGMPGWSQINGGDPLAIDQTLKVAALLPHGLSLFAVGAADPTRSSDKPHMKRVEATLERGKVKALKCYLGYLPFGPEHEARRPYYELARKYKIPVIFHTGDTYSRKARVKLAHPLGVDEVAVDFPDVRFVLAHLGNPWILDAAEVIYKNNQFGDGNVWADVSALFVSSQAQHYENTGILDDIRKKVRHAIAFTERPDRFLYASDWPLNRMDFYRDFIKNTVPAQHHKAIFRDNAKQLFGL